VRAPALAGHLDEPGPDSRVGPYRLIRRLGEGGMGIVYLAERDDAGFRQRVALKVIRGGLERDPRLRHRFLEERQILASLQHPNIAVLHDGGVTDQGAPWFAMELVDGTPLAAHAEAHRLSRSARLDLFLDVAAAVQHAHRNLVIHRDLKPSNILVTAEGRVKLLDFGIAKLIDPARAATTLTQGGGQPFTPEYASPEQILGRPISTASDVYSLGVVLYELLTGRRPRSFADRPIAEWAAAITQPPPAPGIDRDLDTVLLKALQLEPERRYESAGALAEDLRRYRRGDPVAARPDTWSYRTSRFVRRHRWGVAVATGVLALLLGAAGAVAWQARLTGQQAVRATAARDFLLNVLVESDPNLRAEGALRTEDILSRTASTMDSALAAYPDVRRELAEMLGKVQTHNGRFGIADTLLGKAIALTEAMEPRPGVATASALTALANLRLAEGRLAAAESLVVRAGAILEPIPPRVRDSAYASTLRIHATVLRRMNRYPESVAKYREALAATARAGSESEAIQNDLAVALMDVGNWPAADSALAAAIAIGQRTNPNQPIDPIYLLNQANIKDAIGHFDSAVAVYRQVVDRFKAVYPDGHERVIIGLNNLGYSSMDMGDFDAAARTFEEAQSVALRVLGPDHFTTLIVTNNRGRVAIRAGRPREAAVHLAGALATARRVLGPEHPWIAVPLGLLGQADVVLGQAVRGQARLDSALRRARETVGPDHPRVADLEFALGNLLVDRGNPVEAEPLLRHSLEFRRRQLGAFDPDVGAGAMALGRARMARGATGEADSLLAEAIRRLRLRPFRPTELARAEQLMAEIRGGR